MKHSPHGSGAQSLEPAQQPFTLRGFPDVGQQPVYIHALGHEIIGKSLNVELEHLPAEAEEAKNEELYQFLRATAISEFFQKDYFKKFSKLITPVRAARWAQLENQLGLLIELQVVSEIPFAVKPAE